MKNPNIISIDVEVSSMYGEPIWIGCVKEENTTVYSM